MKAKPAKPSRTQLASINTLGIIRCSDFCLCSVFDWIPVQVQAFPFFLDYDSSLHLQKIGFTGGPFQMPFGGSAIQSLITAVTISLMVHKSIYQGGLLKGDIRDAVAGRQILSKSSVFVRAALTVQVNHRLDLEYCAEWNAE